MQAVELGTDNTPAGSQSKVEATVTANQGVKHWVVMGCNDENVSGGVKGLNNAGVKGADIIGVGLGAYLACKDWQAGADNGMRAALYIPGDEVGKLAVQAMYDKLKNGTPFTPNPSPRPRWSTRGAGRPRASAASEGGACTR